MFLKAKEISVAEVPSIFPHVNIAEPWLMEKGAVPLNA